MLNVYCKYLAIKQSIVSNLHRMSCDGSTLHIILLHHSEHCTNCTHLLQRTEIKIKGILNPVTLLLVIMCAVCVYTFSFSISIRFAEIHIQMAF